MNAKHLFLAFLMPATLCVYAQNAVDKALVTTQAEAAKKAADALKNVDTGDKAWKFDGVIGLNGAATGLWNWAAGGKNNVNGIAYAKLHLLYHKNSIAWETNFDTDFGITWVDQEEDALQKSSDNIKLATKLGWEFHESWYLTVLGGFQSQYAIGRDYVTGYNPAISKWLAPSYTDVSVGIDWKKSYNGADFSVYLSPLAGRIATAYVGDAWNKKYTEEMYKGPLDVALAAGEITPEDYAAQVGNYNYQQELEAHNDLRSSLQEKYGTYKYKPKEGTDDFVKDYRNVRAEFGLSFKGAIAYKYENLTLSTTLGLFTPYAGKGYSLNGSDDYFKYSNKNRQFGNFDVDWDVAVSYQFLKVLNVTLSTSLKYYNGTLIEGKDGALAERVQFKSVLGLGIGYSF